MAPATRRPRPGATGALLSALLLTASGARAQTVPYLDPSLPAERRVQDLLSRMTLEEKIGQLTQISVLRLMGRGEWDRGTLSESWMDRILGEQHVGSLLSGGGAAPVPNTPEAWARMTNDLQRFALDASRLKIPILYGVDAVHGHNNVIGATMFPHNVNLAATFDPKLTRQIAEVTARALRATGIHWNFAPAADIGGDPRWGRFYETWGESPLVASEMVAASVRGLQGEAPGPDTVAATLKHFVGYGAPVGGKDRADARITNDQLRAVHLPPFVAGVAAGAATVMVNSGSVNGVPSHASRALLTDVLRTELGFTGVAISDWEDIRRLQTVHRVAPTYRDAVKQALLAGVDVSMVPHDAQGFTGAVLDLVRSGEVPEARVNEAAGRVLDLKFRLGLFEKPYADPTTAQAAVTAGKDLALNAARQSIVLLENRGGTLPLGKSAGNVLVVGERARDPRSQLGGWTVGWHGLPKEEDTRAVTVLDGMKQAVPAGTSVAFSASVPAQPAADTLVVVVGEPPHAEGEADNPRLALPDTDVQLLRAAIRTGKPVVAVLLTGRPVVLPDDVQRGVRALVAGFLPGSEGGRAVADVLYGTVSPSGRLPFTWPASADQVPVTTGTPLYPFGHGLSYTSFTYEQVRATDSEISVRVRNTGRVPGAHTVLAFATGGNTTGERLVGFGRLRVEPGAVRDLALTVPRGALAEGQEVRVGNVRVRVTGP